MANGTGPSRRTFLGLLGGLVVAGFVAVGWWAHWFARWWGWIKGIFTRPGPTTFENVIVVSDCLTGEQRTLQIDEDAVLSIASPLMKRILDEWCDRIDEVDRLAEAFPDGPSADGLEAFLSTCWEGTGETTPAGGMSNVSGC